MSTDEPVILVEEDLTHVARPSLEDDSTSVISIESIENEYDIPKKSLESAEAIELSDDDDDDVLIEDTGKSDIIFVEKITTPSDHPKCDKVVPMSFWCGVCRKLFDDVEKLANHTEVHNDPSSNDGPLELSVDIIDEHVEYSVARRGATISRVNSHTEETIDLSDDDGSTYDGDDEIKTEVEESATKLQVEGTRPSKRAKKEDHRVLTRKRPPPYCCNICQKIFGTGAGLASHKRMHYKNELDDMSCKQKMGLNRKINNEKSVEIVTTAEQTDGVLTADTVLPMLGNSWSGSSILPVISSVQSLAPSLSQPDSSEAPSNNDTVDPAASLAKPGSVVLPSLLLSTATTQNIVLPNNVITAGTSSKLQNGTPLLGNVSSKAMSSSILPTKNNQTTQSTKTNAQTTHWTLPMPSSCPGEHAPCANIPTDNHDVPSTPIENSVNQSDERSFSRIESIDGEVVVNIAPICEKEMTPSDPDVYSYDCYHCNTNFSNRRSLGAHMRIHTRLPGERVKLYNAVLLQNYIKRGQLHVKSVNGNAVAYICPICGLESSDPPFINAHLDGHKKNWRGYGYHLSCDTCNYKFGNHKQLSDHHRLYHRDLQKRGAENIQGTPSETSEEHLRIQNTKKQTDWTSKRAETDNGFACPNCSKSFAMQCHLTKHKKVCLGKKIAAGETEICIDLDSDEKDSPDADLVTAPQRSPRRKCSASDFATPKELHSGDSEKRDPDSASDFATPKELHSGDSEKRDQDSYECPDCGEVFTMRGHFAEHCKTHENDNPYRCKHCDARLDGPISFAKHMDKHKGHSDLLFSCHLCASRFKKKAGLVAHMRTHAKVSKFTCSHCNATFDSQLQLKIHINKHGGTGPGGHYYISKDQPAKASH